MKYIKTEDGVYGPLKNSDFILEKGTFFGKPILKQSNNPKELCDEFIVDANYRDKPYLYDRNEPVDSPEFDSEDEVVYGAIWARGEHGEPILKPVIKLDQKRKWKLL